MRGLYPAFFTLSAKNRRTAEKLWVVSPPAMALRLKIVVVLEHSLDLEEGFIYGGEVGAVFDPAKGIPHTPALSLFETRLLTLSVQIPIDGDRAT